MTSKPRGTGKTHRAKPELGVAFSLLHVYVGWLIAFSTEEEKAKAARPQNCWHTKNIRLAELKRKMACDCGLTTGKSAANDLRKPQFLGAAGNLVRARRLGVSAFGGCICVLDSRAIGAPDADPVFLNDPQPLHDRLGREQR